MLRSGRPSTATFGMIFLGMLWCWTGAAGAAPARKTGKDTKAASRPQQRTPLSADHPVEVENLPDAIEKGEVTIKAAKRGGDVTVAGAVPFSNGQLCAWCAERWTLVPKLRLPLGHGKTLVSGPEGAVVKRVKAKGLVLEEGEAHVEGGR